MLLLCFVKHKSVPKILLHSSMSIVICGLSHMWTQSSSVSISLLTVNVEGNLSNSNTAVTPSQKLEALLLNQSSIFSIPGVCFY